jgi:uncharacterized protein YcnI
MIRKVSVALLLALAITTVQAHVTVWPKESRQGAWEKYIVRVPTEGKSATTSVELQIPEGVTVVSMGAPNGFKYELKKAGDRVVSIVWIMTINPNEFAEFAFMAKNPQSGAVIAWKATQFFADGTKSEWAAPADGKHPASITKLTAH